MQDGDLKEILEDRSTAITCKETPYKTDFKKPIAHQSFDFLQRAPKTLNRKRDFVAGELEPIDCINDMEEEKSSFHFLSQEEFRYDTPKIKL